METRRVIYGLVRGYLSGEARYRALIRRNRALKRYRNGRAFLDHVAADPHALEYRWGDLPVFGAALKVFGAWEAESNVDPAIRYLHRSYDSVVQEGVVAFPGT